MKSAYRSGLPNPKVRNKKGSILFLTLVFLVLINLFAVAFWKLIPVEMNSAKRHLLETEAYFASDAGVTDSLAFLESLTLAGNIDNYISSNGVVNSDGHRVIRRTGQINTWTWEAEIIPGPETFGNNGFTVPNPIRVFNIVSVARRPGSTATTKEQYREVSCWVKQKSYAQDGWGVNGLATGSSRLWLNMESFKLGGTYRVNGEASVDVPDGFWSNTTPAIGGELLYSQAVQNDHLNQVVDGVMYKAFDDDDEVPYDVDSGAPIAGRYEALVQNGRAAVRNVEEAILPPNTDSVAFGVYGTTLPTSALNRTGSFFGEGHSGGYVNARINGTSPGGAARNGIYIEGDVSQVEFRTVRQNASGNLVNYTNQASLNGTENQAIRIYQGTSSNGYVEILHVTDSDYRIPTNATVVGGTHTPGETLSASANGGLGWTVVRDGRTNKTTVYQEQTNGAIYATGDIAGVRGIVKGRRTVATQTDEGSGTADDRRIRINGDLLYAGTTPGSTPDTTDDMLGLISYAVKLTSNDAGTAPTDGSPQLGRMWPTRGSTSDTNPLYLYCSIFAGRDDDPRANDFINAGGFGTDSHNSGNRGHMRLYGSINEGIRLAKGTYNQSNGSGSGFGYDFELDPGLEQVQPPFFPTRPSYDVLTWEERSVFAY